jgi:small subunit ribosomal protein S6
MPGHFRFQQIRARPRQGRQSDCQRWCTKLEGEVLVSRLWNDQKLAYPIDGHRKGTYWLTYFKLNGQRLTEFNRELAINETVVRSLTLWVEPRLVEALVETRQGWFASAGSQSRPSARPNA